MADASPGPTPPDGPEQRDDAFVRSTFRLAGWAGENLQSVFVGAGVIALIVVGIVYYSNFQARVRGQAATELASLRLGAANPENLIADLEAYVDRFGGIDAADEGRLLLARNYLDNDQAVEAARVASDISAPADRPVGRAARSLLAAAQEATGDAEAALATYESLGEQARFGFQRREARAAAARILVSLGRMDEAAAVYAALAEEAADENPSEAGTYRLRLGEIKGEQSSADNG